MASAIDPDGITILRSEADGVTGVDDQLRLIPASAATQIRFLDPRSGQPAGPCRSRLSPRVASPIRNRFLTHADIVLPVGCVQCEHWAGYFGIHTPIYPEYSDKHTQARFRKHDRFTGNGRHRELQHEVNHVAWLLGVNFSAWVVPVAGDGILHALAGQSDVVRRQAACFIGPPGSVVTHRAG